MQLPEIQKELAEPAAEGLGLVIEWFKSIPPWAGVVLVVGLVVLWLWRRK